MVQSFNDNYKLYVLNNVCEQKYKILFLILLKFFSRSVSSFYVHNQRKQIRFTLSSLSCE